MAIWIFRIVMLGIALTLIWYGADDPCQVAYNEQPLSCVSEQVNAEGVTCQQVLGWTPSGTPIMGDCP